MSGPRCSRADSTLPSRPPAATTSSQETVLRSRVWHFVPVTGLDRRAMNYVLLSFIPVSLALRYLLDVQPIWVFVAGAAAIGVLADWVRRATEQLAHRAGATIGDLLNVSFGNIAELVLALFVLSEAETQVVQAQRHRRSAVNALSSTQS